jgi:hypothetical protein
MGKIARKIGLFAAGLAGLVLTSGCATSRAPDGFVLKPSASGSGYRTYEARSGADLSSRQLEENPEDETKRGGFSVGLSLKPIEYKFYDAHAWVPVPKGDFVLNLMGAEPTRVRLEGGYDCTLNLGARYEGTVSGNTGWYSGLSIGVSGQRIYSGKKDPDETGDISETEKFDSNDTREEPTCATIKADPRLLSVAAGAGLQYFITDETSLSLGPTISYNGFEVTSGALVQALLDGPRTYEKLTTTSSSGVGIGGELSLKTMLGDSSALSLGAEWGRSNLGKIGHVDQRCISLGWEFRF